MERCQREGHAAPRELGGSRARKRPAFWFFANAWRDLFKNGVLDHPIKELCRLYISRSVQCDYCGNQRSVKAAGAGMIEDDVKDLLNFEKSTRYSERQKAALAYAEAIAWHLNTDDVLLGAHAPALQRGGAGRARLHDRPYARAAELAAPLEHRSPPGARGNDGIDGAGIRDRRSAAAHEVKARLLG
jgi:hypothetical protein